MTLFPIVRSFTTNIKIFFMDTIQKYLLAIVPALVLSSCSTEQMMKQVFNRNRSSNLELYLEMQKDTLYCNEDFRDVCKVVLSNPDRRPYYVREPVVMQYDRFKDFPFVIVDYERDSCEKCRVLEGSTKLKIGLPKYMILRHKKPAVSFFSPNVKEMHCYGCEANESEILYGLYQINARFVIENDTIFSNQVKFWYLEKRE